MSSQIDIIDYAESGEVATISLPWPIIVGGYVDAYKYIDKETRQYVIYIPSLEISGYGATEGKAMEMVEFSLKDYAEYLLGFSE